MTSVLCRLKIHFVPLTTLLLLCVCVGVLFAPVGFSFREDGWVRHFGWRIAQGDVPYRDFFVPTTPLVYYISAGLTTAFGSSQLVEWVAVGVLRCILTGSLYYISCILWQRPKAALCVTIVVMCNFFLFSNRTWFLWYCDTAMSFFALSSCLIWKLLYEAHSDSRRVVLSVLCGAAMFATLATKQTYGATIAVLYIFASLDTVLCRGMSVYKVSWAPLVSIALAVMGLGYLWHHDALQAFHQSIVLDAAQIKAGQGALLTRLISLGDYYIRLYFVSGHLLGCFLFLTAIGNSESSPSLTNMRKLCGASLAAIGLYALCKAGGNPGALAQATGSWINQTLTVALPWYYTIAIALWLRSFGGRESSSALIFALVAGACFMTAQRLSGWTNGTALVLPPVFFLGGSTFVGRSKSIERLAVVWLVAAGLLFRLNYSPGELETYSEISYTLPYEQSYARVGYTNANLLNKITQSVAALESVRPRVMLYPSAAILYDYLDVTSPSTEFEVYYSDFLPPRGEVAVMEALYHDPPSLIICDPYDGMEALENSTDGFQRALYTFLQEYYILDDSYPNGYQRNSYFYKLRDREKSG